MTPDTPRAKSNQTIHVLDRFRIALLWPLALIIKLWGRTLRFRVAIDDEALLLDSSEPTVVAFWHNRLFLARELYRRYRAPRKIYALISASRDGAWLAAYARLIGIDVVRGSSSRRGTEAMRELTMRLRKDRCDVALTPDGPRGPCYSFKPGVAIVARGAGAPVLLVGAIFDRAWRLRSWDGFLLPRPFSRVLIRCRRINACDFEQDIDAACERLRCELLELNGAVQDEPPPISRDSHPAVKRGRERS